MLGQQLLEQSVDPEAEQDVLERLTGLREERVELRRGGELLVLLAALNVLSTSALDTVMCSRAASAWYQYALIRKSMTWLEYEVKSCLQSALICLSGVLARVGTLLRTWAMQDVKFGGSLGTITGAPGFCEAWLLAATYSQ